MICFAVNIGSALAQSPTNKILDIDGQNRFDEPALTLTPNQEEQLTDYLNRLEGAEDSDKKKSHFSQRAAHRKSQNDDDELRIGIILPETRLKNLVGLMHQAAQMALFNSDHPNVQLFFYNIDKINKKDARKIIKRTNKDKIDIILGPLFAESVAEIAPFAGKNGVPVIAFSNSEDIAREGVYVFGLTPTPQTKQIINYSLDERNKNIAIFAPANDYGRLIVDNARKILNENQKKLNYVAFYDEESKDLSQQVRQFSHYDYRKLQLNRLKKEIATTLKNGNSGEIEILSKRILEDISPNLRQNYQNLPASNILSREARRLNDIDTITPPPFDSVLIAVNSSKIMRTIISLFSFFDINTKNTHIYGLQLWDEIPSLQKDPAMVNARHVTLDSKNYRKFKKDYRALFNKKPPTLIALVYDATNFAIEASSKTGRILPEDLERITGYHGVTANIRFKQNGAVERLYGIKLIDGAKSRNILNVPDNFSN